MKKILLSLLTLTVVAVNGNSQVICRVLEPASIVGNKTFTWADSWGATPNFLTPGVYIEDTLAIAEDGTSGNSTTTIVHPLSQEGCAPFINAAQIAGKIAVVYRGTCNFTVKAINAQAAGAVGVIIINRDPEAIGLGGTDPLVTIPAVMITSTDGAAITAQMATEPVIAFIGNKQGLLPNDVTVSSEYAKIPVKAGNSNLLSTDIFQPALKVYNFGVLNQTAASANLKIVGPGIGGATVYDETISSLSIPSGDSISIEPNTTNTFPTLDLTTLAIGEYFLTYMASTTASMTDLDSSDNSYSSSFKITSNYISSSRLDSNNDPIHNSYPQSSTLTGVYEACMSYVNPNSSELMVTGIKFVPSADTSAYDLTGEEVLVNIYEWTAPNDLTTLATPAIFTTTVNLTDNNDTKQVKNVTLTTPVSLASEIAYLVCVTSNSHEKLVFGYDNGINYDGNMSYDTLYESPMRVGTTWYSGWDGTNAISIALQVEENTLGLKEISTLEATVFPNPTNDLLNIRLNTTGKATVIISDLTGKAVQSNELQFINGAAQVNTANLTSGAYLMNITTENGISKIINVIKK